MGASWTEEHRYPSGCSSYYSESFLSQWKATHFLQGLRKPSFAAVELSLWTNTMTQWAWTKKINFIKRLWCILLFLFNSMSAFLELWVHPTSSNCLPTKFWNTSNSESYVSILFIKVHLPYSIFLYFPSATMSQSNGIQTTEYSALTILSFNQKKYCIILNLATTHGQYTLMRDVDKVLSDSSTYGWNIHTVQYTPPEDSSHHWFCHI